MEVGYLFYPFRFSLIKIISMLSTFFELVFISIIATSGMTLFSYALSSLKKQQFREPQLLNTILNDSSIITISFNKNHGLGWLIHYTIGLIFTVLFYFLYKINWLELDALPTFLFGIGIGLVGVIGWKSMFSVFKSIESIPLGKFYFHLVLAHLTFAISLTVSFIYFEI